MQHKTIGSVGFGVLIAAFCGCATEGAASSEGEGAPAAQTAQAMAAPAPEKRPYRPGETPIGAVGDEPDSAVGVQLERGYLNQNDVNAVLEQFTPRLIECYERAGAARRYAAGEVKLRFLVAASGEVTDVLVVGNQLGSYPVERCLVVEGRKIPFPKPGGNRPSDFDYNIEFRSTHPQTVVDWKPEEFGRKLSGKVPALSRCGSPGEGAVAAVAYVRPGGRVVSVGLTSEKPIDTMAAKCVVDQIQSWRLPAEKAHLVRTHFAISAGKGEQPTVASSAASGSSTIGPTARLRRMRRR